MKKIIFIVSAFALLGQSILLTAAEKPVVHLAGLRIVGPGYGLNGTELQAFYQKSGTTIALVVEAPKNRKIVDIDDDKCSMTEFTDDAGNNLLDGIDWSGFPKISDDGLLALVEVSSRTRPSMGAVRIHARGTVYMRVAASDVSEKIDHLKLQVGQTAQIYGETVKVMKVEAENDGLTLVIQISRNLKDNMKDIRFYTVGGDPVEILGRGSFTFGNAAQMEYNLDQKSIPEALKVEIDVWKELETLNLPFDIKSGVGF